MDANKLLGMYKSTPSPFSITNWKSIEITIAGNDREWETDLDSAYAGVQKIILGF